VLSLNLGWYAGYPDWDLHALSHFLKANAWTAAFKFMFTGLSTISAMDLWKWFLKTMVWLSLIIFSSQPFMCELSFVYRWVTWCHSEQFGIIWLAYSQKGVFQTVYHSETNDLVGVTPNWITYAVLHFHFLPNNKMLWHKMTVMWHLCLWFEVLTALFVFWDVTLLLGEWLLIFQT